MGVNVAGSDVAVGASAGTGGAISIVHVPFTFATANSTAVYTPTIGTLLIDLWVQVNTAWNAAGFFDIGTLAGTGSTHRGLVAAAAGAWNASTNFGFDMTKADTYTEYGNDPVEGGTQNDLAQTSSLGAGSGGTINLNNGVRGVPAYFATASPLLIWVTQNGLSNGTASTASAGAAVLYLMTATFQ